MSVKSRKHDTKTYRIQIINKPGQILIVEIRRTFHVLRSIKYFTELVTIVGRRDVKAMEVL